MEQKVFFGKFGYLLGRQTLLNPLTSSELVDFFWPQQ